MRMVLVILAALIVASGTGFYVIQGLRSPAPEVVAQ
jgi:ABC-type proline/glycine betaine transport system permease subunit